MSNFTKFVAMTLLAVGAATMVVADAEARRMGGRSSLGRQSNNVTQMQRAPQAPAQNVQRPAQPNAATGAAANAARPSPWKGIAGGLLGGLAIGALLSHLGMGGLLGGLGGMLMSLLTIALVVMAGVFLFRMIRGKQQPQPRMAGAAAGAGGGFQQHFPMGGNAAQDNAYARTSQTGGTPEIGSGLGQAGAQSSFNQSQAQGTPWGIPAGFDAASFLRNAKTYFIRLQAAWDKADINDIREFTSPEMFAEIRMQLTERGASVNNTDVVTIDAELLGVETLGHDYMASVKFTGTIREEDGPAEPFAEVWNLTKPVSGTGGWVLAGIQQIN